jgi:hypothetical protein
LAAKLGHSKLLMIERGRSSKPGRVKNFLHFVQIGSGAGPTSYSMSTGGSFPGGKSGPSVKLTTHLKLLLRLRKC